MNKISLRSDRDTDYVFTYKGEEKVLQPGERIDIIGGLEDVVLPTCAMKVVSGVIVIKQDV